jgi:hypothetical protein
MALRDSPAMKIKNTLLLISLLASPWPRES